MQTQSITSTFIQIQKGTEKETIQKKETLKAIFLGAELLYESLCLYVGN